LYALRRPFTLIAALVTALIMAIGAWMAPSDVARTAT
jgi:hypothetical protein